MHRLGLPTLQTIVEKWKNIMVINQSCLLLGITLKKHWLFHSFDKNCIQCTKSDSLSLFSPILFSLLKNSDEHILIAVLTLGFNYSFFLICYLIICNWTKLRNEIINEWTNEFLPCENMLTISINEILLNVRSNVNNVWLILVRNKLHVYIVSAATKRNKHIQIEQKTTDDKIHSIYCLIVCQLIY